MRIKNSKNYKFSNAFHLQFVMEILGLIIKFDQIRLKIIEWFSIFNVCVEKESSCYKIVRKSNLSQLKKESDKARDGVLVAIKHVVKAEIRNPNLEKREAAQRIKIVLDTYDKPVPIIRLQYDAETAVINKLIQELNTKYADDMQKIGLTSWVEELQIKNNEFDQLVKSYHEEASEKPDFHLIDLRKETDKAYQDMIERINALALLDPDHSYDQFITEINTLIKHYEDELAKHLGRLGDKETAYDEKS